MIADVGDPDPEVAIRDAIRHGPSLTALAAFAAARHGYYDTNGGFGFTYPGDLDEYDRIVDGLHIPEGFVRVCGFWGPPEGYEVFVAESVYLKTLAVILATAGHSEEALQVKSLAEQQETPKGKL